MTYLEALHGMALPSFQHHELKRGANPSLSKPDTVVYSGGSARRRLFLESAFPEKSILNTPIGEEPRGDMADAMRYKIHTAIPQVPKLEGSLAVISADVQNITPEVCSETGMVRMISQPKPGNVEDIRNIFGRMVRVSDAVNQPPFYIGASASGMLHVNGAHHFVEDDMRTVVELDRSMFGDLTTEQGFKKYLRAFAAFYGGEAYLSNNMKVDPTSLSAGFSLPVLTRMGIVQSVDGVQRSDDRFRDVLLGGIFNVAVGISPRLLHSMQVDGTSAVMNWPWLNEVVDNALVKN